MSEDAELLAVEQLGDAAKKFHESDIGRYLQGVAKQDEDDAKDRLLAVDVWKYTNLSYLQNDIAAIQEKVKRYRALHQYIIEAIAAGEQAGFQLSSAGDD